MFLCLRADFVQAGAVERIEMGLVDSAQVRDDSARDDLSVDLIELLSGGRIGRSGVALLEFVGNGDKPPCHFDGIVVGNEPLGG